MPRCGRWCLQSEGVAREQDQHAEPDQQELRYRGSLERADGLATGRLVRQEVSGDTRRP